MREIKQFLSWGSEDAMKVRALIIVAVILAMAGSAWAGECSTAGIDITPLDDLTMAGRNSFRPQDVAVSPNGDVFVTDAVHGKVMVFDRNGKIKRSLERKDPYGIDVDSAGNVYIGWASYNDAGHFTGEVDVYNQWLNYQGTLGTGWAEFKLPYSIATDDTRVYVADNRGNAIKVYDKGTRQLLTSFGGFCQDPGCVVMPSGIAVKDGTIYISDAALSTGTYDGTSGVGIGAGAHIFTIDDSNNVTFVKRFGQYGAGAPGVFQSAAGVAVDGEGRVFVSDSSYGYVQVFNADGNYICTFSQGEYNMFSRGMEVNAEGKLALSAFDRVFRYGIGQYADLQVSPSLLTAAYRLHKRSILQITAPGR
jgi:hypothetical protein